MDSHMPIVVDVIRQGGGRCIGRVTGIKSYNACAKAGIGGVLQAVEFSAAHGCPAKGGREGGSGKVIRFQQR